MYTALCFYFYLLDLLLGQFVELALYLGKLYLHNHLMNIGRRNFRRNQLQKKMI